MAPSNKPKKRIGRPRGTGRATEVSVMAGVRLTPEERSRFNALALAYNYTFSQLVRKALHDLELALNEKYRSIP